MSYSESTYGNAKTSKIIGLGTTDYCGLLNGYYSNFAETYNTRGTNSLDPDFFVVDSSDCVSLSITAPLDQTIIIQNVGVIAPTISTQSSSGALQPLPSIRLFAQADGAAVEAEVHYDLAMSSDNSFTTYGSVATWILSSEKVSAGFNQKVINPGTTTTFTVGYAARISSTSFGARIYGRILSIDVSFLRRTFSI